MEEKKAAKEKADEEEAKKPKAAAQKLMPDGLYHVVQNGKDRAFDPLTGKEVDQSEIFD